MEAHCTDQYILCLPWLLCCLSLAGRASYFSFLIQDYRRITICPTRLPKKIVNLFYALEALCINHCVLFFVYACCHVYCHYNMFVVLFISNLYCSLFSFLTKTSKRLPDTIFPFLIELNDCVICSFFFFFLCQANSDSYVVKTLDRKTLWEMQTPQVYLLKEITYDIIIFLRLL